jgi:hypothetical protein
MLTKPINGSAGCGITDAGCWAGAANGHAAALPSAAMNSLRRVSALQRFIGKPIAIRDVLEPVLMGS